jgi:hypothetical protein
MARLRPHLAALCILAVAGNVVAGERRDLPATRVPTGTIVVDGVGADLAWLRARRQGSFVQRHPEPGQPASQPTFVTIAFDDEALYVLIEARDSSPESITAALTRRDEFSVSDWVHLWLDTYQDGLSAYRFSVNARGVKQDARVYNGVEEDVNWDAVWDSAVRRGPDGWVAELRIPFSQVRYDSDRSSWGIQVGRTLMRRREESHASPVPEGTTRFVRHFGRVTGLEGLPRPLRLELVPYGRSALRIEEGGESLDWSAGADARLGIGPALTLDVTANPDFGQVEADPSTLNLSGFETFLPEKRPFFTTGSEAFRFPTRYGDGGVENLFYTRRIGRVPKTDLDLEDDQILHYPHSTTILGAAKLTGRTSDGWTIGALGAVTRRERADVLVDGVASRPLVDALMNAGVLRVTKQLRDGQTTVGGMATYLLRERDDAAEIGLVHRSVTGGLDVEHREGHFTLLSRLMGSQVSGSQGAIDDLQRSSVHYFQRPDAAHVDYDPSRHSLAGWGLTHVAGKLSGQPWRGGSGVHVRSPGYDPNELGYLRRADEQSAFGWLQYRRDDPTGWFEKFQLYANASGAKTFGDERTSTGADAGGWGMFPSGWTLYGGVARNLHNLDVAALRGGPALMVPGRWTWWAGGATDERKNWTVRTDVWGEEGDDDSRRILSGTARLELRPVPSVQLMVGPAWQRSLNNHQYVDTVNGDDTIVGRLHQDTLSLTLRASWALTPALTLQYYAMPYFSAGRYERFYLVVAPRANEYVDRFRQTAYDGDDRFLFEQLRSNLVLRWEYLGGSSLFLVWSRDQGRDRDDVGGLEPRRDVGSLLRARSEDVIALKLAHWFAL